VKIKIGEDEYPFVHPAEAPSAALIAMHRQTGLTFEVIQDGMERLAATKDEDPVAFATRVLSDIELLLTVGALVFIAKWCAGQRVTFEEATDIPFSSVLITLEPGDEGEVGEQGEALTLPDSVPAGNRAARRATSTRSRSQTSKVPSIGG
jgi:hypothetical protein